MPNSFILKIRRAETPFFRSLKGIAKALITATLPLPRLIYPLLRWLFTSQQVVLSIFRKTFTFFIREPLFRGRCESVGKRFAMSRMPFIVGHAKIYIGEDVNFFGKLDVFSGRIFDEPKLIIGNRVDLGHGVWFVVNKEIIIEDDVNVASNVCFMDTDAHPKDAAERAADLPPHPDEVKPVRICKSAWIGQHSFIMKGVTIGEGAVVGVNSVVVTDIPAWAVAMGNPARVVMKGVAPGAAKPATPQPAATA